MFKSDRIRRWFGYSRRERQGTYLLSLILVVVLIVRLSGVMRPGTAPLEELLNDVEEQATVTLFPFDPNSAGIEDLVLLGLTRRQATTLENYRNAGGRFREPGDFRKVYGIDSSLQEKLIPYIYIDEAASGDIGEDAGSSRDPVSRNWDDNRRGGRTAGTDSRAPGSIRERDLAAGRSEGGGNRDYDNRYYDNRDNSSRTPWQSGTAEKNPLRIELNSADSLLLKSLPGIGNVLSSRIVRYRNLLGGFVTVKQLAEVYGIDSLLTARLEPLLFTDTTLVRAIDINSAGYGDLLRHPYISEIEASRIINYRNRAGVIESISELPINRIIEPVRFRRVLPYLTLSNDSIFLPA